MARKSTRRDFLRGVSASDAVEDHVDRLLPEQPDAAAPAPYAVHISRRAMACEFEVVLNAMQYAGGTEAALDALDLVDQLEHQLSYFRPDSEISHINRVAADEPAVVEPRLFDLLVLAQQLHTETDGVLDLTATPLWKAWGFARRQGRLPDEDELKEALDKTGAGLVSLDPETRSIVFSKDGVELNLGSIGKGYALDRVAEQLQRAGVEDFLIHGGQSSVLACGSRLETGSEGGWSVGVGHPLRPGKRLGELRLHNRSLGTSGSAAQFFRHQGRRYSHILDPRSGRPAEGVLSATVLAPTATLADALSTAFFVMGREKAFEYCRRHELAAILVLPAPGSPGYEIVTIGIDPGDFKRSAEF